MAKSRRVFGKRVLMEKEYVAETEFSYTPKIDAVITTTNFEVDAGSHGTFDIEYTIKGGSVEDMRNRFREFFPNS